MARRASDNVQQVENSPVGKGENCSPGSSSIPEQRNVSSALSEDLTSLADMKNVKMEHYPIEPAMRASDTGGLVEKSTSCPKRLVYLMGHEISWTVTNKSTPSCFTRPALQCRDDLNRVKVENHPVEPDKRFSVRLTQAKSSLAREGAKCAPGTYCAENLMREVEDRCEDGYFLSSEWLLSLEQNQRESLMLFLSRAGYSETYHTSMTTLFERIDNDGKYRVTGNNPSSMVTKDEICTKDLQVGAPQGGDA